MNLSIRIIIKSPQSFGTSCTVPLSMETSVYVSLVIRKVVVDYLLMRGFPLELRGNYVCLSQFLTLTDAES